MKKGILIVVEGIDGAGKRTLCTFIREFLESKNIEVVQFEYPDYSSIWGKIIENYLSNKIELNINEEFFLYFIDILKDQIKIQKLLDSGTTIILDRYFTSTIAYQCAKGFSYQKALSVVNVMEIIVPDLTLFIQISSTSALKRKLDQKKYLDRHEENAKLLENVNDMYEKMLNENILSKRWIKIDGNQDLGKIKINIKNEIVKNQMCSLL